MLRVFGFHACKYFKNIWLSNLLALNVPDEAAQFDIYVFIDRLNAP
jgi:hypothetical protein